jgi:hypothetical protein
MTATDALLERVRAALANEPLVEEKRAFGGQMFMVRGKMCVSVRETRMMFRIDPAMHETVLPREGCRTTVMNGRPCRGYVQVDAAQVRRRAELDFWMGLALDYSRTLASAPAKKRRRHSARPASRHERVIYEETE